MDRYKYLGTTFDREMTLSALISDVSKLILNKLFTLIKLRRYITDKCALSIYKQTVLPLFDYVNFMLVSCYKSDRQDLQIIQNDASRTCCNVRCRDRISIANMHIKANLLSLEQRRNIQLLGLMFVHSKNPANI